MEKSERGQAKSELLSPLKETCHVLAAVNLAKMKLAATAILCMTVPNALPFVVGLSVALP